MHHWLKDNLLAVIIVFVIAGMFGYWRITYLEALEIQAEIAKTKAEQGHKLKFGVTREK